MAERAGLAEMSELTLHPLCHLFPLMSSEDMQRLVSDIVQRKGQILDGRHRYRACAAAGVEPRYKEYDGDDPLGYVISLNMARRHLTESQRAMIAAKIENMRQGERTDLEPNANLHKVSRGEAARLMNVSPRSVAPREPLSRAVDMLGATRSSSARIRIDATVSPSRVHFQPPQ
jgi:hypothetical protein